MGKSISHYLETPDEAHPQTFPLSELILKPSDSDLGICSTRFGLCGIDTWPGPTTEDPG